MRWRRHLSCTAEREQRARFTSHQGSHSILGSRAAGSKEVHAVSWRNNLAKTTRELNQLEVCPCLAFRSLA